PALNALNLARPSRFKMASAMIERAEFPVQRKSTLSGSLLLTTSIRRPPLTTICQNCRDEWLAHRRLSLTTILDQKSEQLADPFNVNCVNYRPAFLAGCD